MPRLVVDANVMVSAILGRSFPYLIETFRRNVSLLAPVQQLSETRAVLLHKLGDQEVVGDRMADLLALIEPVTIERFAAAEAAAKERLPAAADRDWPVLGAAMTLDANIWSNDRDFFGCGVAVWSTRNVHAFGLRPGDTTGEI